MLKRVVPCGQSGGINTRCYKSSSTHSRFASLLSSISACSIKESVRLLLSLSRFCVRYARLGGEIYERLWSTGMKSLHPCCVIWVRRSSTKVAVANFSKPGVVHLRWINAAPHKHTPMRGCILLEPGRSAFDFSGRDFRYVTGVLPVPGQVSALLPV